MATPTASDILVETLIDWHVDTVFGIPGDGINGIMEALRTRQDRIRFVQVRHEESAALAACAYAKWTGRLGVCLATSGPGGIHLLNGLYDAKLDRQPVLAITGLQYHDLLGTFTQQDVELDRLFMDVAQYNARVMGPSHVENAVQLACRTALSYRCVAHVTVPVDVQSHKVDPKERSDRNVPEHASDRLAPSARLPSPEELSRAAVLLNGGSRTVILAGQGALGASRELAAVAERLGNVLVGPTIPFGVSEHHMAFPGTITLDTATFKAVVRHYVASLAHHGFTTVIVIPSHGGNFAPLRELEEETGGQIGGARYLPYTDLMAFMKPMEEIAAQDGITPQVAGAHAGEAETSMVLAARPDLVDMSQAAEGFVGTFDAAAAQLIFERGMTALTANGILGDARPADAARGERYIAALADMLAAYFRERM